MALNSVLGEGLLQKFVVLNELVVGTSTPIDARQLDRSWKNKVGDLTSNGATSCFFDFR